MFQGYLEKGHLVTLISDNLSANIRRKTELKIEQFFREQNLQILADLTRNQRTIQEKLTNQTVFN